MEGYNNFGEQCMGRAIFIRDALNGYKVKCALKDEQLAGILSTSINVVYAIQSGHVYISPYAIPYFESKLGVDLSYIISNIGSSPTLFNCSQSSGFVYKIVGCDADGMHRLNYKDGFLEIISAIREEYALEYVGCRNEIFEQNIRIVDSRMDEILQNAILMQVGYLDGGESSSIPDMSEALAKLNPIGVKNPKIFYEAKLKTFLFASFAGMTASTEWNGRKKLTGGYIDVDKEGEMLYYRAISDDIFENYLFKHTYVDRPDRGVNKDLAVARAKALIDESRELTDEEIYEIEHKKNINPKTGKREKKDKKGDFGYVYQDGDDFYIVINFQVRFR